MSFGAIFKEVCNPEELLTTAIFGIDARLRVVKSPPMTIAPDGPGSKEYTVELLLACGVHDPSTVPVAGSNAAALYLVVFVALTEENLPPTYSLEF